MGLFSFFLGYRAGRKRAQNDRDEFDEFDVDPFEICDNCRHERVQHDDSGRCPRYD
jgi:hypothetical protein